MRVVSFSMVNIGLIHSDVVCRFDVNDHALSK